MWHSRGGVLTTQYSLDKLYSRDKGKAKYDIITLLVTKTKQHDNNVTTKGKTQGKKTCINSLLEC